MCAQVFFRPINSALWNDPMHLSGVLPNKHRGTGMLFGADVVRRFCDRCGVEMILRSHEQVGPRLSTPHAHIARSRPPNRRFAEKILLSAISPAK